MALVVGAVVVAVRGVELAQPGPNVVERRGRREVEDEGPHLRAQEVVRARRAEGGESRQAFPAQEVEHLVAVGEVPDVRLIS